jgi:hypothetical protein
MFCGWVDGLDCHLLIKKKEIPKILNLPQCTNDIQKLFEVLNYICYGEVPDSNYQLNFTSQ